MMMLAQSQSAAQSTSLIDQLATLEPSMQGAIVGAAAALLATLLTLIVTSGVTMLQLRHARKERDKDRALELKKEVFLEATAGLSESMAVIMTIANVDLSEEDLNNQRQQANAKAVQVNAVGSIQTVSAVGELLKQIAKTTFRLMPERFKVVNLKIDADVARSTVERAISEQARVLNLREELYLRDAPQHLLEHLQGMFDHHNRAINEASAERDQFQESMTAARIALLLLCAKESVALQPLKIQAMDSIRKEMGIDPMDSTDYASISEVDEEDLLNSLSDALEPLRPATAVSIEQPPATTIER